MRTDAILVNEIQLGDSLNQAVQHDRRGDFSLMLAMMVQDVRYQSQFQLQRDEFGERIPLRQQFHLGDPQPLLCRFDKAQRSVENAKAFHHSGLTQSRLQHYLKPEALEVQGEQSHGMTQALANAEPWTNKRSQLKTSARFPQQMDLANLIAEQRLLSQSLSVAA